MRRLVAELLMLLCAFGLVQAHAQQLRDPTVPPTRPPCARRRCQPDRRMSSPARSTSLCEMANDSSCMKPVCTRRVRRLARRASNALLRPKCGCGRTAWCASCSFFRALRFASGRLDCRHLCDRPTLYLPFPPSHPPQPATRSTPAVQAKNAKSIHHDLLILRFFNRVGRTAATRRAGRLVVGPLRGHACWLRR